jgi:hypothetical protein
MAERDEGGSLPRAAGGVLSSWAVARNRSFKRLTRLASRGATILSKMEREVL